MTDGLLDIVVRVGEIAFAAGATIAYIRYRIDRLEAATERLERRVRAHGQQLRRIRNILNLNSSTPQVTPSQPEPPCSSSP